MIVIPSDILAYIVGHARKQAPIEACGLLAGTNSTATKAYRLTNLDASPEHFSLDPKEQFAAAKDMRRHGLDVVAVYHSHPATPARMSEEDLRLAFAPGICYVVVSLADPENPDVKGYKVEDGLPVEEKLVIQESQE
ncbi:MAG: M67 family metallopeptidase [Armatimonadota bacterium]|nr:M67 family metallopeptidase [Armatimonadota bacterium]